MPVVMQMEKMPLTIIRPLCLLIEKDIKEYAELCGYKKQVKLCPYEKASNRTDMKQMFEEIEKINPEWFKYPEQKKELEKFLNQ